MCFVKSHLPHNKRGEGGLQRKFPERQDCLREKEIQGLKRKEKGPKVI